MTARRVSDWGDIYSEYRTIFDRLRMTEVVAREFVAHALDVADQLGVDTDGDQIADALKEFTVLSDERYGTGTDLYVRLLSGLLVLNLCADLTVIRSTAVSLFGSPGEHLCLVLRELKPKLVGDPPGE